MPCLLLLFDMISRIFHTVYLRKILIKSYSPGVWRFTWRIATDVDLAAMPLLPAVPVLQISPFGRAKRYSFWFLALFFHSVNTTLYVLKVELDQWSLLVKCSSSLITLVVCIGLLILLGQSFPITWDFWIVGGTFGIFYLSTVMVTMSFSQSTIVLEFIHIPITLFMNILRFSCQVAILQFDWAPFSVAMLGIIGACLPFLPDPHFSAYKIASLIGGVFRFLDVMFIWGVPQDKANLFLVRFHEFLL